MDVTEKVMKTRTLFHVKKVDRLEASGVLGMTSNSETRPRAVRLEFIPAHSALMQSTSKGEPLVDPLLIV